ncbi:histidine phosphatase family protein [Bombilactobacillus folatiphilus]|uniref:Histidine phosphatase family protein n=1 Tax=Bombilactobacillus folatiphilus TaxID=2923362 RepID=A0ABY4P7B8_9LACO|nr:histidine phosphatase family protein [Bombilactobacillus folatiphilus]UQS81491.1 histidine phosphatase family protein [Bombilactobacillus folatiphilus]
MFKKVTKVLSVLALGVAGGIALQQPQVTQATKQKPVVIYLTRHGETTANVMHVAQGWSDYPLTNNGKQGAKALGLGLKKVKFQSAYAGNLTRQEETAQGALKYSDNKKVKLQTKPDLREDNYGSYEGRPDMKESVVKIAKYYGYPNVQTFTKKTGKQVMQKMQDGYYQLDKENELQTDLKPRDRAESSKQVQKRMTDVLTQIAQHQKKNGGGNVLVVSSGMSIDQFLSAERIPEYQGKSLDNDSVTKLVYKNKKFKLQGKIGSTKYYDAGKQDLKSNK